MRLKYNILWFDDDTDWIESVEDDIQEFLLENGFILNFDNHKNAQKLDTLITDMKNNTKDVDIILMDYKLLNHDKGDILIKKIRQQEVLTEILFYSQDAAVRNKFKEECIEGIYFSNRSDFLDRLFQIIPHTIKKVLDLTNMRGLVMAETSTLDLLLNDVLINMFSVLDKHDSCRRQEIIDKVFHKRLKHAHSIKEIEHEKIKRKGKDDLEFKVNTKNKEEYISDISLLLENIESSDRFQAVNKLYKIINKKVEVDSSKFDIFKKYDDEIIKIRNILAHVHEEVIDGKTVLKSKVRGYNKFTFSHTEFEKIRKSLILHSDNIKKLDLEICKNL
ncbi:MAG: Unknown protein [uncultured Campylobacterales bacterium]|uniref:Response regulatory domain-containing protein n=1 Tax=uncultured Campylobacterales bacterium TaxID=352960 RepID=A0A6S6TEU5_9BACT|nr:MAG: Unknown protein [uncultured Campylobacterales bacterium]